MSHAGEPPPDDQSDQQPDQQPDQPAPYNPYPDNWDAPQTGSQAFVAGDPGAGPGADPYAAPPAGNPYGTPGAYGAYASQEPANPYAGNPNPNKPTFGFNGYAGWFTRVGAYLVDSLIALVASAPLVVGEVIRLQNTHLVHHADGTVTSQVSGPTAGASLLILVGFLTGLAFQVWNVGFRQGRTGASIGKSVLAIRLVNSDLQPIGAGWALLRQLLHILDGLPCICLPLGYLWPLWDDRKQTFADKIMHSFVIQAAEQQPRPY